LQVSVTNTGKYDSDEVIQAYVVQPEATVITPNIRLADFERVNVTIGSTVDVRLYITPRYHSVVYNTTSPSWYEPLIYIEKGFIEIYVGGGQPQYYEGALHLKVYINGTAPLSNCPYQS